MMKQDNIFRKHLWDDKLHLGSKPGYPGCCNEGHMCVLMRNDTPREFVLRESCQGVVGLYEYHLGELVATLRTSPYDTLQFGDKALLNWQPLLISKEILKYLQPARFSAENVIVIDKKFFQNEDQNDGHKCSDSDVFNSGDDYDALSDESECDCNYCMPSLYV